MQLKVPKSQKAAKSALLEKIQKTDKIGLGEEPPTSLDAIETAPESFVLPCLVTLRESDAASGVHFRDCLVDYTACTESRCIRKLV